MTVDTAEINRLYDSGLSMTEVSKIVKLHVKTVRKYLINVRSAGRPKGAVYVTAEMIDRINGLHDSGKNYREIAEVLDITAPTVSKYIKNPKKTHKTYRFTVGDLQRINRLYNSGTNADEISEIYGCSKSTIYKYIWDPKPRGGKAIV